MAAEGHTRERTRSHAEYLESLHRPSAAESRRISDIQQRRESEIDQKYHTAEEHEAAATIQRAYRGHRTRREMNGLTLDPSSRWVELIEEWRFRSATAPQYGPSSSRVSSDGRPRAPSDTAKYNWKRAGQIAEHAGHGDSPEKQRDTSQDANEAKSQEQVESMLLDRRYFLEMVDQKHRYGANLLVYHAEWLRSGSDENFFYWLDRGDGRHLNLSYCSREKLDKERIRYLSRDERAAYLVQVDDEGKFRWQKNDELVTTSVDQYKDSMYGIVAKDNDDTPAFNDDSVARSLAEGRHFVRQIVRTHSGNPDLFDISEGSSSDDSNDVDVDSVPVEGTTRKKRREFRKRFKVSPGAILNSLLRKSVKPGTWIYVADTVGRLYVGIKESGAFQHASFLSGARISSAGAIGIEKGQLVYLSPLSGHYRPTTKSFRIFIRSLKDQGVDLSQLRVSKAFEVLLGIEYYGKTKKAIHHHKKEDESKRPTSSELNQRSQTNVNSLSATSEVEQSWHKEHKSGIARLMDDLQIRRRSFEGKKES